MEGADDRIGRCEDRLPLVSAGIFDVSHLAIDRLAVLKDELQGNLPVNAQGDFNGLNLFAIDCRVGGILIGLSDPMK